MYYFDSTMIDGPIYMHQVGNKLNGEPLILSSEELSISQDALRCIKRYFLSSFKKEEYYCFWHHSSLLMNEVYCYIKSIFEDLTSIESNSKYLAKSLYSRCSNSNIKGGDFYIVHFRNCLVDSQMVDAIGLFKSENKDSFLQVSRKGNGFEILEEKGININKLDKGCLIFNTDSNGGYTSIIIDNSNRTEAKYWVEDFLGMKRKQDAYTQSQNAIALCKSFLSQLPIENSKAEKAIMMIRVIDGLNSNSVNIDDLATYAFGQEIAESSFKSFRCDYQEQNEIIFSDNFEGKPECVRKSAINNLRTLRLDNNFVVSIRGGEELLENGYDEKTGMKYYKLYFNMEK